MTKEKDWELVQAREKFLNKEIIPSKVLPHLADILTAEDNERILADEDNNGPIFASRTFIDRLKRRGETAFAAFVVALRKAGYGNTALLLDPNSEGEFRST